MNNKEVTYELIDAYLRGEMEETQRIAFEQRLEKDPELVREVTLHREIRAALTDEGEIALEQKLKALGEQYMTEQTGMVRQLNRMHRRFLIAAAVVIVGMLSFWAIRFSNPGPASADSLFAQHYSPYKVVTVRGDSLIKDQAITEAFDAYRNQNYANALAGFQAILSSDSSFIPAYFYAGICHLELNHPQSAILAFQKVIDDHKNLFVQQAQWYLALSFLTANQPEDAKAILTPLQNTTGTFGQQAADLLEKMEP